MAELRTETIDGESWTEHPARVYCRECRRETHPAVETMPGEVDECATFARCWVCGEEYQCDECGSSLLVGYEGGGNAVVAICEAEDSHP